MLGDHRRSGTYVVDLAARAQLSQDEDRLALRVRLDNILLATVSHV